MSIIYLSGYMGCGKSTIGRQLSNITGYKFIDLDSYIEEKEKMTIPYIFENYGEEAFRDKEFRAISEIKGSNIIIATGGGALTFERNAQIAKSRGKVVFIDTPFKDCYNRIKNSPSRPKVSQSKYDGLKELFSERRPLYIKYSDITVDGHDTVMGIVNNLLIKLK